MPEPDQDQFREVFRNVCVTGFTAGFLFRTFFQVLFGIVFTAVFLYFIFYFLLVAAYVFFRIDVFPQMGIRLATEDIRPTLSSVIGAVIGIAVALALWAYLGPHNLVRFWHRLKGRMYVL